jgi:hypothetical protein
MKRFVMNAVRVFALAAYVIADRLLPVLAPTDGRARSAQRHDSEHTTSPHLLLEIHGNASPVWPIR